MVKELEEVPEDLPDQEEEEKPEPVKPEEPTSAIQSIRNKLQKPKKEETPAPEAVVQPKYEYKIPQECLDDIVKNSISRYS